MDEFAIVLVVFVLCAHVHSQNMPGQEKIPMDIYRKLAELTSRDDFEEQFMDKEQYKEENEEPVESGIFSKIGDSPWPNDPCSPRPTTVMIPNDHVQPTQIQWPMCVKVKRCGGCCVTDKYVCNPTRTNRIDVSVRKYTFHPHYKVFRRGDWSTIKLEEHLACEQQCRVQAKDCTSKHTYNSTECECKCKSGILDCDYSIRFFDESTCACECQPRLCPKGERFSNKTCRCEANVGIFSKINLKNGQSFQRTVSGAGSKEKDNCSTTKRCGPGWTGAMGLGGECGCKPNAQMSAAPIESRNPADTEFKPQTSAAPITSKGKDDCSTTKRCPPGFKAVMGNDGKCNCKPNFGG